MQLGSSLGVRSLARGSALLLIAWCVKTQAAEIPAESKTLLDGFAATCKTTKAFAVSIHHEVRFPGQKAAAGQREITLVVEKPNKINATIKLGSSLTRYQSDGKTYTAWQKPPNEYLKEEAPETLQDVAHNLVPGLEIILSGDPIADLLDEVNAVVPSGTEKINGATCRKIRLLQEKSVVELTLETGVSTVLRKMIIQPADARLARTEIRFDEWKINPGLDPGSFAFVPPKDAKEYSPHKDTREAVRVPPIKVSPDSPTEKMARRAHHEWAKRVFPSSFSDVGANAKARTAFLEKAMEDIWYEEEEGHAKLTEEGDALLQAGCDDPLVVYLVSRLRFFEDDSWAKARLAMIALLDRPAGDSTVPRALLCFIGGDLRFYNQIGHEHDDTLTKRILGWTKEALKDGSYRPEDADLFLDDLLTQKRSELFEKHIREFDEACTGTTLPEWAQRTLHGYLETESAWKSRGGEYATNLSKEKQAGFEEHLQKARTELLQAWKLHPESPYAAGRMIRVAMGAGAGGGESARTWFDRAVAARFDYMPAYDAMRFANQPRWGGNVDLMLAFGQACLDTKRYDTDVPIVFGHAVDDVVDETEGSLAQLYKVRRDVWKGMLELHEAGLKNARLPRIKALRAAGLLRNAWSGGDYALAAQTLSDFPDAKEQLFVGDLAKSPMEILADIAMHQGKGSAENARGDRYMQKSRWPEARAAFDAALAVAPPAAHSYLRSRLSTIDFEQALAGGDWVKIKPTKDLADWVVRSGDWHAEADGAIVNVGHNNRGLIVYRGRVGPSYEMRGTFDIASTSHCCHNLAMPLGYSAGEDSSWKGCGLWQSDHSPSIATLFTGYYYLQGSPTPRVQFEELNTFLLRVEDGRVTYELNGKKCLDQVTPDRGFPQLKDGLIGFTSPNFCRNNITRISGIEVRRLPAKQ